VRPFFPAFTAANVVTCSYVPAFCKWTCCHRSFAHRSGSSGRTFAVCDSSSYAALTAPLRQDDAKRLLFILYPSYLTAVYFAVLPSTTPTGATFQARIFTNRRNGRRRSEGMNAASELPRRHVCTCSPTLPTRLRLPPRHLCYARSLTRGRMGLPAHPQPLGTGGRRDGDAYPRTAFLCCSPLSPICRISWRGGRPRAVRPYTKRSTTGTTTARAAVLLYLRLTDDAGHEQPHAFGRKVACRTIAP